jgi:hypothetical protein
MSFLESHKWRQEEPPNRPETLAAHNLGVAWPAEAETLATGHVDKHGTP